MGADRVMVSSPNRPEEQEFQSQKSQGSVYTLAIDEVQTLCKKSSSSSSSSSSFSHPLILGNLNLHGTLCKKTVDEVWRDIVHCDHGNDGVQTQQIQRQLPLGETRIEDFLARAGIINIGNTHRSNLIDHQPLMSVDPMVIMSHQHADWLQFQMSSFQQQQQQNLTMVDSSFCVSESMCENPVVDCGYGETQLGVTAIPPLQAMVATPAESQGGGEQRKRRYTDEMMEKTIERRQKRMIKNRESAARSRARKQAYTNHLENEVFHLRKTNSWLKKQKEAEVMLSTVPVSGSKYQLRRTSSAQF
ncbi:ABSCISIC ACID-INSENSITIVE 5-like protein 3 [Carica papaya]|uniref:ABSCISIC ACID-INSENSITIVE 5-like protein 3 n=1 Tax=Carica papaya TaxID=3649 RepID=UPI000B8CFB75|nr:ABSCISIC ACID-INSENSITIVE 5-like protein 3 [Carica papaya]